MPPFLVSMCVSAPSHTGTDVHSIDATGPQHYKPWHSGITVILWKRIFYIKVYIVYIIHNSLDNQEYFGKYWTCVFLYTYIIICYNVHSDKGCISYTCTQHLNHIINIKQNIVSKQWQFV